MTELKCPQCGTVVDAPETGTATCPSCGFSAPVGNQERRPSPTPRAEDAPRPTYAAPGRPPTFAAPPAHAGTAEVAGKPRGFWTSFFLGIITIGIYYLVWNYKTFRELDRQHDREHEELWYWLGFVFLFVPVPFASAVLYLVYAFKEIENVEAYRAERGLRPGISPGLFLALFLLGIITLGITMIVGYYKLTRSQNEVWRDAYARAGRPWPLTG